MRVLVVEDEQVMAQSLHWGLQAEGYVVDIAGDGIDGLWKAQENAYDVIILDVMLPGLDGLALCQRLRAGGRHLPVLLLTARDAVDDRVAGLDSGADDYLSKPFAFRELLARVRALLRREGRSREPVLRAGDLTLDPATREVRRGGRAIELTSKEYAVLEYLLHHPNRVLTRTQIAEHVWDYDFVAMSNVIDVYIRSLRRKLDDDGATRLLHTVRGTGYQLRSPS